MGRGTAANSIIQLLGLGDTSKDIAYVVVDDSILEKTLLSVKEATSSKKSHFGVMFTVNVSDFIRSGNPNQEKPEGENNMAQNESYKLINVIVNKGYAEDAMAAARKAGAGGGTIIGARGTAKEGDAKFFGAEIVPEKDMLLILVPKEKCDDIVNAIQSLPCFAKAGSGIIFCSNAHDFTLLGKSEKAE
jgi:nitrogen regulatory protein PII